MKIEAYKEFAKEFKYMRKDLVNKSKKFNVFDYTFINDVFFIMIKSFHRFYTDKELLYQDTEHEMSNWKEQCKVLDRCVEIINKLEKDFISVYDKEDELLEELYTLVGKNIKYWWD